MLSVHRIRSICLPSQISLSSLLSKQRIVRGVPLSEQNLVKNFKTVRVSVILQICAVGHLLKRSTATKLNTSPRVLELIGPAKSNCISWFVSDKSSLLFDFVQSICVLWFLPVALQLGQLSDFSRISRWTPGHQNASAA